MDDYNNLYKYIDYLRSRGMQDSDPEMLKLRIQLRDALENSKKNRKPAGPLPTLTAIKTLHYDTNLGTEIDEGLSKTKKFVLMGIFLGIAVVIFKLFISDS